MKRRIIVVLIIVVLIALVVMFSGCLEEGTQSQVQNSDEDENAIVYNSYLELMKDFRLRDGKFGYSKLSPGDTAVIYDSISYIEYEPEYDDDKTVMQFTSFNTDEKYEYQYIKFNGDLTSEYSVGDEVTITHHIISKEGHEMADPNYYDIQSQYSHVSIVETTDETKIPEKTYEITYSKVQKTTGIHPYESYVTIKNTDTIRRGYTVSGKLTIDDRELKWSSGGAIVPNPGAAHSEDDWQYDLRIYLEAGEEKTVCLGYIFLDEGEVTNSEYIVKPLALNS